MAQRKRLHTKKQLTDLGEAALLRRIRKRYGALKPGLLTAIGDDAAALSAQKGITLIATDSLLEGIHFDLSYTHYYQLGYKLLAIHISDIYAMGGRPLYFLLNLGLPRDTRIRDVEEFYEGVMAIAGRTGVSIIGGDTCESKHGLLLSGALMGRAEKVIKRSGARKGEGIFVTSTLGDSAMGLMLLRKMKRRIPTAVLRAHPRSMKRFVKAGRRRFRCREAIPLLRRHLMPEPAPLKNKKNVSSMIDISDGLLTDLGHICEESRVGAVICLEKLPMSRETIAAARVTGVNAVECALRGGEDYSLLFTAPEQRRRDAVRIGEITEKGRVIVDAHNRKTPFPGGGYEHFK